MSDILQKYQELLQHIDRWFARAIELYPERIACKSGCSGCCRGNFDITLLDAFLLKLGFDALPDRTREKVLKSCRERLQLVQLQWPEFAHPYLLNYRPEEDWELFMPEDDETPCVLTGDDGRCLVYANRPMTCRLHGLPLIDSDGEVMHDEWCTMNFPGEDPTEREGLRAPFDALFRQEVSLFREFTGELIKMRMSELDTFIPTALLIDFQGFDWEKWGREFVPCESES